jgi:hypothetical protein
MAATDGAAAELLVRSAPLSCSAARVGGGPVGDLRAPLLRGQGPDRPAGHGKADQSLGQATPCSQSQIGHCCHLPGWATAQVEAGMALSVVVRS